MDDPGKSAELFFDLSIDLLCIADADGYFLRMNPAWEDVLGYSVGELEGRSFFDFVHPDDIAATQQITRDLTQKKQITGFINRYRTKQGEYRWIKWRAVAHGEYIYAAATDITDQREAEQRLRGIIDNAPFGALEYELHSDNRLVFSGYNEAANRILGVDCSKFTGLTIEDAFPPLAGTGVPEAYRRVAQTGESYEGTQLAYSSGEISGVYEIFAYQIAPMRMTVFFRDITEARKAEDQLRLFKHSVDASTDAVGMSTPRGRHYYQNEAFTNLFGDIGDNPPSTLYVDEAVGNDVFRTIMAGGRWTGEVKMYARDGRILDIYLRAYSSKDEEGNVTGLVGMHTDITERKRAEEELRASKEKMQSIFRAAPVGIGVIRNRIFLEVNMQVCEMSGYSTGELLGHSSRMIYPTQEEFEFVGREKYRQIAEQGVGTVETKWQKKDGTIIDILLSSSPINAADLSQGVTFTALDITERKQAERDLQELNQQLDRRVRDRTGQLEVANRDLESFNYSVSHDLRAPLRRISGFVNVIREDYGDRLDDEGRHYLERITDAIGNMGGLIDDLLSLSRIGRENVRYERVDLSALAGDILQTLKQQEPEREVEAWIQDNMTAETDSSLLRIALENLLGNAWKFTGKRERAGIWFGVEYGGAEPVYYVRDNGVGFDMKYASKLFEPFRRLHAPEEYQGTGIGLAIVQRVFRTLGGNVWVESEPDVGTTFYFTLPGR